MAQRKPPRTDKVAPPFLTGDELLPGVSGSGKWLIVRYHPSTLFSLKLSRATSGVGKTLVIPTPYAFKMALVDAAFRTGWAGDVADIVRALARADIRISPAESCVVTHTIVRIRQEPKKPTPEQPYIAAVAYREYVHMRGELRCAVSLSSVTESAAAAVLRLAPSIWYLGKRGSMVQFLGFERQTDLTSTFTQRIEATDLPLPKRSHLAWLDDFGPEATLEILSSFSDAKARRGKDRQFANTIVPVGIVSVGPGFTEYSAI